MSDFQEKYEIINPNVSAHNLIIGTLYIDIGGTSSVRPLRNNNLTCILKWSKKAWFSSDMYNVEGDVIQVNNNKTDKKGTPLYKVHGKWDSKIYVTKYENGVLDNSTTKLVFDKNPQPPNATYMYGLSQHGLQLNYFPNYLKNQLPPTDTRFRPDQRMVEDGLFKEAAVEKDRLEKR